MTSEEEKRMAIIDVHLDWCGPCVCMEPNYSAIWFSMDEPQTRISFWQIAESNLPEAWKEKLQVNVRPKFLVFFGGQLK